MDGPGAGSDSDERPKRVDRFATGDRLRAVLGTAALVLGVLAGLGVVAELLVDLLRAGIALMPVAALGAVALVAAAALLIGRRLAGGGHRARSRAAEGAAATDVPSRRALRWQRRLGGGGAPPPAEGEGRPGRRARRRRGRGPTSSRGG